GGGRIKCTDTESPAAPPAILSEQIARLAGLGKGELNPLIRDMIVNAKPASKADIAKLYGDLLRKTYEQSKQPGTKLTEAQRQLVDVVTDKSSPCWFPKSQTYYHMSRSEKDQFGSLRNNLDKIAVQSAAAPPRAMVLNDTQDLYEPHIFVRGNAASPGDAVPRRFLQILGGGAAFPHGSGRLDLARAITAPNNPLTARVIVNRIWMEHFGEPLVATPSDFGIRSSPPSLPELLDWLAATIMEDSWSLKKLHRR